MADAAVSLAARHAVRAQSPKWCPSYGGVTDPKVAAKDESDGDKLDAPHHDSQSDNGVAVGGGYCDRQHGARRMCISGRLESGRFGASVAVRVGAAR